MSIEALSRAAGRDLVVDDGSSGFEFSVRFLRRNWRLNQQRESIRVMEIRFVDRMTERPIREPIVSLDNGGEPETEGSLRVDRGQSVKLNTAVELKRSISRTHGNVRPQAFVRLGATVAIPGESIDGPLSGRSKIELVVCRLSIDRDEGFEAGMLPELRGHALCGRRKDPKAGNISVEAITEIKFGGCGSPYEHPHGPHRISSRRWMAAEIAAMFDDHNACGDGEFPNNFRCLLIVTRR
ncbi:MAG TPA: hypothetical protein VJN94_00765 [Candidatus Binataceae bacterium]|nr:hypothetical protein [Candidatus Binataceae bacterium]